MENIVEDLYDLAVDELVIYIKILNLPGIVYKAHGYDFKRNIINSLES